MNMETAKHLPLSRVGPVTSGIPEPASRHEREGGAAWDAEIDSLLEMLPGVLSAVRKTTRRTSEFMESLVEELSYRLPGAWRYLERIMMAAARPATTEGMRGDAIRLEDQKPWQEVRPRLLEACLRGQERRIRETSDRIRDMGRFPDTLAATVDPLTLVKMGMERLKKMLGMRRAVYFRTDTGNGLVAIAGDGKDRILNTIELEPKERAVLERGEPLVPFPAEGNRGGSGEARTRMSLLLPLMVRGRLDGAVLLEGEEGVDVARPVDLEMAVGFAHRLAAALENARLHAREQQKIKEIVALLEMARVVNSTLDLKEILERLVRMSVEVCPVVLCLVYIREEGIYRPRAWCGFIEECLWELEKRDGFREEELGEERGRLLERGEPVTLDCNEAGVLLPTELLCENGVEGVDVFPLLSRGRLVGLFALFYAGKTGEEDPGRKQLAETIAAQASLAIENASLYEDIERSYFSTVQALAKAIEVKDPYTRGHSERVTTYALLIAEAMGLDERERQKLKYAATLHDIGKIGIAGRVLNKPGALTEEEYTHVKTHPLLGDSIVEPVEFLQEPRPIILHHHERYDGKGYPAGLKGEDIPLSARILAVADAFEAMRSDRPYRKALPMEEARNELIRNAGTQFDPRVVDVFLKILEEHGGDPIER